jgi:hypothetical protein
VKYAYEIAWGGMIYITAFYDNRFRHSLSQLCERS